jgi:hypothetical protein
MPHSDVLTIANFKVRGMTTKAKVRTVPLWPDVAVALGLSRNGVYNAAARGEIAGLLRFGRKLVVGRDALERMLQEGNRKQPEPTPDVPRQSQPRR